MCACVYLLRMPCKIVDWTKTYLIHNNEIFFLQIRDNNFIPNRFSRARTNRQRHVLFFLFFPIFPGNLTSGHAIECVKSYGIRYIFDCMQLNFHYAMKFYVRAFCSATTDTPTVNGIFIHMNSSENVWTNRCGYGWEIELGKQKCHWIRWVESREREGAAGEHTEIIFNDYVHAIQ